MLMTVGIVDMPSEESEALLDAVFDHAGKRKSGLAVFYGLSNTITLETKAFTSRACVRPQAAAIAPKFSLR
jgi:hypothetical protein